MSEKNLNDMILSTYNSNLIYLKEHHLKTYEKIKLLETALENQMYTQQYELEYKDSYFDVYQHVNGSFLYNQDSNKYSRNIIEKMTFDEVSDNIKPYRDFKIDEESFVTLENIDMMSSFLAGVSPFIHYIDKNLQQKQVDSNIHKFIFFGVGLGLHLKEVYNKFNCKMYFICEQDLELFRLSLFTTKYNEIAKSVKLIFSVADTEFEYQIKCNSFLEYRFALNHNIKFNLFSQQATSLMKLFQPQVTGQSFLTYTYDRHFMTNERFFKYVNDKCYFLNMTNKKDRITTLSNYPILILAAGPSIKKNIQWLIDNYSKFIIITVSANLRFLYEHKIKPDIIMHMDEDKTQNLESFSTIDMNFFKNSLVIHSSFTHPEVSDKFKNNTKYIIQFFVSYYNCLDSFFAPSIGEASYGFSLLYGAKNIYLLGLDFALDPETNQSHYGNHVDEIIHDKINDDYTKETLTLDYDYKYIKGNFREKVCTTARLNISIPKFNYFTMAFKSPDVSVYNLSDGAYLDNTTSLNVNNFDTNMYIPLDKNKVINSVNNDLYENSENEFNEYDKKLLKRKLKNAKYIKNLIHVQSKKIKYHEVKSFLKDIELLIKNITEDKNKTDCKELNKILYEYTRLVSHYIYNFCEQNINNTNESVHIENMNKIFSTKLLTIVDKYINLIKIV